MQQTAEDQGYDVDNPYALTKLEQQVVDLLTSGLTGDEVGDLLAIDRRSVALRRASAMRKYGARNGMHLAHLMAITRRLARASDEFVVIEDIQTSFSI